MGIIVGTFIGIFSDTGIVHSGVGVGSGVGMNGGAQCIVSCRRFAVDSITLHILYCKLRKGVGYLDCSG